MNGTPRLRSAFPATPRSDPRFSAFNPRQSYPTPSTQASSARPSPNVKPPSSAQPVAAVAANPASNETLIPLDVLDAPTQRLYAVSFYIALTAWRFYNYWHISDDLDSTWLFLKWLGIDAAFFVGLPAFRIPWLEWSFATTLAVWLTHAVVNLFLMYQIPIPVGAWLGALLKLAYDRELAISEHRVNPENVLHNSSIILGKQIIHILPEGSALFNPGKEAFCLDSTRAAVELPIQINQTAPMLIELLRTDLDTQEQETITIGARQAKQLKKQADKGHQRSDTATPRILRYSTSKKGMYQLVRVIDESKLEVRGRSVDTMVVACPQALISAGTEDRCTGELSGVSLQVSGTPPFKVRYSKQINKQQSSSITETVSPPDLESPLSSDPSDILVDPKRPFLGWSRTSTYTVDINESLHQNGSWLYTVEEIEDGLGNKVTYSSDDIPKATSKAIAGREQRLTVHHRPKVYLAGCDAEHFLKVAKEDATSLPLRLRPTDQLAAQDWPLTLKYSFSPETTAENRGTYEELYVMGNDRTLPRISKAGKYDLKSIESQFCAGEVNEPSSCLLYNPPEPDLGITSEDVIDKCAGNPIGMNVNLDFTGTPPFKVRYTVTHRGTARPRVQEFGTLRGQMEFKEQSAGSYIYHFLELQDAVYGSRSLKGKNLVLTQDIKPPASAAFARGPSVTKACLGQPVGFDVNLSGEGPWDLEYEVVHGGKRKKETVHSDSSVLHILPSLLLEGGKQTVILTGVQDKSQCKTSIREERAIEVRPEQPQAAFGDLDGKRSISALEGRSVKLPLRLKGLAPWSVRISNLDRPSETASEHHLREANAIVSVDQPGTYEIQSVHDTCPGIIDSNAKTFRVSWVPRPTLALRDDTLSFGSNTFRKPAVCEGDEGSFGLTITGRPPYEIRYAQKAEPLKGSSSVSHKQITAAIGSALVHLDTTKAGEYTYSFNELSDSSYDFDRRKFQPLHVQQKVHPLPTAKFSNPGKTYGHCKDDGGETENIPITLEGIPPFTIEVGVAHHGNGRPEIIRQKDILSNQYSWTYSRSGLDLGTHAVNLRSVTDSRGCERTIDRDTSAVRIMVSNPPSIIPLESHADFCVGERVSYSLSGQPPFEVFYKFQGKDRKASSSSTTFRRIAEQPGEFTITAVSDHASGKCKASKEITKHIHPMPSVKISKGKTAIADIHEGGEVEIHFEFTGTPPFEFTYIRSENAKRSKKPAVLETRNDKSYEFTKTVRASEEGTYEVVAIKDKFCAFSLQKGPGQGGKGQKLLTN